jgi:chromosome segregation ATPase
MKELNKIVQDLTKEIKILKKTKREAILEMENLQKRLGVTDAGITNRIQEIEERISGVEDTIEDTDIRVNENRKSKKLLTQNIQEIQDTMKRTNLRILGIEESKVFQLKGPLKHCQQNYRRKCP